MRIASLVTLAVLLAPTAVAHADDPPEGTAVAATAGTDPDALFDRMVDDHYDAMSDGRPCSEAGGCHSTVWKTLKLAKGAVVEVRKATAEYGDVYALEFSDGNGGWSGAAVLDDIEVDDCGMMKCIDQTIAKVTIREVKSVVWIKVHVKATLTHDEPPFPSTTYHYDVVIGCQRDASVRCASVQAGGPMTAGTATIHGTKVKVKEDDAGDREVALTF